MSGTTSAASRTGASGTKTVPPSASSARNRASSIENRVLPVPPGPTIVSSARLALEPERRSVEELALAPEELRGGSGKVDCTGGPEWRELLVAELEQLCGGVEVLQPVATEIAQRLILDERGGRG